MKVPFGASFRREPKTAQTLVFFLLAWGTIMLLCGLAIDSGLLYLAKARLGRAVDGAALAAVGNFNRSSDPVTNRDDVALIMRNFAVANFTDLGSIASSITNSGGTPLTTTGSNGQPQTSYTYNFNDGTQDANGQYRRFVQVILNTGSGGNITSATCNARCPVQTYFIGYASYAINGRQNVKIGGYSGPSSLVDLKVSSSAVATRNPRLIMVVIDRSGSMLQPGGGASGLPPAVVQFLEFFDTSSDNIGIVSFGSSARLEMPLTTNFLIAGTNDLIDAYETNSSGAAEPGLDPEANPSDPYGRYDPNYATTGVRRLKFGGQTAADDGIRLALEQLMANGGFNDPDVVKYMVIFTDGAWNACRTLVAAPGYTNIVTCPIFTGSAATTNLFETNLASSYGMTNGQEGETIGGTYYDAPWYSGFQNGVLGNLSYNTNLVLVPTLSPLAFATNAMCQPVTYDFANLVPYHTNDIWMSVDATATNEPLGTSGPQVIGAPATYTTNTQVGSGGGNKYYTRSLDVWLQPGAVDYVLTNNVVVGQPFVSDYTKPTQHVLVNLLPGQSNMLVVPGYVADGVVYDGLDLAYPDNPAYDIATYPKYRDDNFQVQDMWSDDVGGVDPTDGNYYTSSLQRQLLFRNYANLLTGFYVFRPDEPTAIYTPSNAKSHGVEPLITEQNPPGAPRSRYGLGAYYPSAGFYWPFGGESDSSGNVTNAVGLDGWSTFAARTPTGGGGRFIAYSINMLSTDAAPEWSGELFYKSVSGGGTNVTSGVGSTAASTIMQSADWKVGAPNWVLSDFANVMTNEPTHDANITGSPSVWRPVTFNGSITPVSSIGAVSPNDTSNLTGGYVTDGNGNYYRNAMAWSGRPTHYYDFTHSKWVPVADNHDKNTQFLQMGNWKASEYAWHARAQGVTIFTVGYGTLVSDDEQAFLAQIANATNTTAGGGTSIAFNPSQPIGQQFYATNAAQISNDFYSVGQAINEALTGGH